MNEATDKLSPQPRLPVTGVRNMFCGPYVTRASRPHEHFDGCGRQKPSDGGRDDRVTGLQSASPTPVTGPAASTRVSRTPTPLRLKHWTFAGLLLTYWCNARCAFCYVYSGPNKRGRGDSLMTVEQALTLWRGLNHQLAADGLKEDGGTPAAGQPLACRIHFAGGEPFYDFDHLLAIARAAQAQGLRVFEKVETNAFWAKEDDETRLRLELLRDAGMGMLMISADVYHQEFVPVERCRRAARIAREVLGDKGVRVRWWDSLEVEVDVLALEPARRRQVFADALVRHRERLLGRAADTLADQYECQPPGFFTNESCAEATLGSRHVHIDSYGNVIPGVCSGIVWGHVAPPPPYNQQATVAPGGNPGLVMDRERDKSASISIALPVIPKDVGANHRWPQQFATIDELWRYAAVKWQEHPIISRVVAGGSYRLYECAREQGYVPRVNGYASKCHLCHDVRRWLREHGYFGTTLGPDEVYRE